MFARLIGSAPAHQEHVGSATSALVLHATLIGLAIQFSARVATRTPDAPPLHLIYTPVVDLSPQPVTRTPAGPSAPCECTLPGFPAPDAPIVAPAEIPNTIPDPGPPILGGGADPSASAGREGEGGSFAPTVELPARPLPGNPQPVYPSLLRSARVEGVIVAHFVVDSAGRVDARSITFESGGQPLFESAARRALLASRYEPARAGRRPIAMHVEQEFAFRITP